MAPAEVVRLAVAGPSCPADQSSLVRQLLAVTLMAVAVILGCLGALVLAAHRMGWHWTIRGEVPTQVPDLLPVIGVAAVAVICTAAVLVVVLRHTLRVAAFTFRSKGAL